MNSHELIDHVANDMTNIESRHDVRAAVLARLDAKPRRAWVRLALPAIAASVAVLLFAITRTPSTVSESPTPQRAARVPANTPTQQVRTPAEVPGTSRETRRANALPMSAEDIAWFERALPALTPALPLGLVAIQPSTLEIAPISVEPVEVEPIAVTDVAAKTGERDRR